MRRTPLPPSRHAQARPGRERRPPDDPHAWGIRRIEREINKALCRYVHRWIPGISRPYAAQLRRTLTVSEAEVPVPGLPAEFDGASLLLITDIHTGPFLSPRTLGEAFDRLLSLRPDAVFLGGDLTTASVDDFMPFSGIFGEVAAAAPLGTFAVLGNHDHYSHDPVRLRGLIEACGIPVLHNTAVALSRGRGRLIVAGIDDLRHGKPDLGAALAEAGRLASQAFEAEAPTILLSHHPDIFFEAAARGVPLVLAGHTHGGQIRFRGLPFLMLKMSVHGLDEGLYHDGWARLVVSRGLGVTGLPLRAGCPPEAVFLRLRRSAGSHRK